ETAFDVTEKALAPIRGIGPVLRRSLLAWRDEVAAAFRYDAAAPPPPGPEGPTPPSPELQALVMRCRQREDALRSQLQKTAIDLEALDRQSTADLEGLRARMEGDLAAAAQTEADLKALG